MKYDLMRSLDAQALQLTNSLGCPSCRKDTAGGADTNAAAPAAAGAAAAAEYVELQRVTPWPAGSGGNGGGAEAVAARARGAVLGCAVGDAAAMGVQVRARAHGWLCS